MASDFRSADQLRGVFELATHCLAPGGRLVFNAFVAHRDYTPDDGALQLGQQCYTTIFTQPQMAAALAGFPLTLVSDESVYDYEKDHLPAEAWPPTSWYTEWVSGQDVFDVPRSERPIKCDGWSTRSPADNFRRTSTKISQFRSNTTLSAAPDAPR